MAFYKDFEKKTRQQKREVASARGGFHDEGSEYTGKKPYGEKKSFGERKSYGEKKTYGERGFGDRKPYRDKPADPKKRYLNGKNGYGEHMPRNQKEDKPAYERTRYERKPVEKKPVFAKPVEPVKAVYNNPLLDDDGDVVPAENLLSGRNPIREALKSGRDIEKLLVARGELSGSAREIVQLAKEKRIPVQEVDRARLDAITHNHQGMLAFASAYQYSTVEAMLDLAKERGEEPFLVLLDGITDPHNLGAIIRSAECAGAHGVIVQERRAVGLTPAAVKASAGAVEHLPVARVTNLSNTIEVLKAQNIWAYAADMDGEDYAQTDFSGGVALVIGAEGEGVSRRVLDICDKTVSLPIRGKLDSLNASVAAGILMYAVLRSR